MADRKALTDRSMLALKNRAPTGERSAIWDTNLPGLCVRISGKGKISFYVVKRRFGATQPTWTMLDHYPIMSLAEARTKARETLNVLSRGEDPAVLRAAALRQRREAEENTFAAVAENFIKRHTVTKRSGGATAGYVRRELIPVWGERAINSITRKDVRELVEAILDRGGVRPLPGSRRATGGPFAARHALSIARTLFNWAIEQDIISASPCDRIKAKKLLGIGSEDLERDRVLNDDEIRAVWNAAAQTSYPYGPVVRLLMLTGQRLSEISGAMWDEIDLDKALLTIGPDRMKAKQGHSVPLTPTVVAILEELPRFAGGPFIFSTRGGAIPTSGGASKAKKRLDAAIGDIPAYTLHDIRRTVRTRLSTLGVTPFVGELCIGHTQKGIHKVYDLHTYDAEKRDALERWERKLLAIVMPEPEPGKGNVVSLRGAA